MMLRIIPLLAGLMVAGGCARMEPYQARDEREAGPKEGLFSGTKGEFVIFKRQDKPDAGEKKKN